MSSAHLAIDLGASSGRAIVGVLDGDPLRLQLEEVHRFEHLACPTPTGPIWDLTGIWQNILHGLYEATKWCHSHSVELRSMGVDTWGVDYVLLTKSGELLSPPHCYRDPRNEPACDRVLEQLGGFPALYERTGIQRLPFNTLFQLAAQHKAEPALFDIADRLLFLPDLFHYWLSGEKTNELTIASTSAMLKAADGSWDIELVDTLGLPTQILGDIITPGACIGKLRQSIAEQTNAPNDLLIVAPASHDTASAVAAVPAVQGGAWAYLSSGTWSLLGAELDAPVVTEEACEVPYTNERGVGNTVRFLKNISGLWIVQELRREFSAAGNDWTFAELTTAAEEHGPSKTLIDANDSCLIQPGSMSEKLRRLARDSGQVEPTSQAALVRCALESLAESYRVTLGQLESVLGTSMDTLHVVGGGIQNRLLNRLTEQAVGKSVLFGPVEATAIGNLLVQAMGCDLIDDLPTLRSIVAASNVATSGQI